MAVTADGGFLFADTGNNVVRKVSAAGVITRVAGTGTVGDAGDDGPATDAQLHQPVGVAVTPAAGSCSPTAATTWCATCRLASLKFPQVMRACGRPARPGLGARRQ